MIFTASFWLLCSTAISQLGVSARVLPYDHHDLPRNYSAIQPLGAGSYNLRSPENTKTASEVAIERQHVTFTKSLGLELVNTTTNVTTTNYSQDHLSSLLTVSEATTAKKKVIKDLEKLGYKWVVDDNAQTYYLEWETKIIDKLIVDKNDPSLFTVDQAYNKIKDKNPNRVPLRDIILSLWNSKLERNVADLEYILYAAVDEQNMIKQMKEVYRMMGRDYDQDAADEASFTLKPRGTAKGEQKAYKLLLTKTPFGAGLSKMLAEYSEFEGRQIFQFEVIWQSPWYYDFKVYFPKT